MEDVPVSEQSQWDTNWTQKRTRRRPPCVRVIVFSKDRAFQLGQYLRTLFAKNRGASLDVHVLYRADSPEMEARDFVASYLRVKDAFPKVHFEREVDFATQLKELVAGADNHVLFGVDDALFCGDLPLGDAVNALQSWPSLLCVHLRLSPGLNFCHTANAIQCLPRLRTAGSELAWFKGSEGSHDWDYPFDLCGTIYRKKTVERVLSEIEETDGPEGLSHPNKLETLGNKALARLSEAGAPLLQLARGCLQRRAMVVVTINRVQSVFCNRVFSSHKATDQRHHHDSNSPSHTAGEPGCESDANARDVNALDRLLYSHAELDEDAYLAHSVLYSSVHVGGLLLKTLNMRDTASTNATPTPPGSADTLAHTDAYSATNPHTPATVGRGPPQPLPLPLPLVSVVMPVRNCERFLAEALRSVQRQTLSLFEVILVDDASTDGSSHLIRNVCEQDKRFREVRLSHNVGVTRALQIGVRMARAEVVARMDADDVCCPDRFRRQLEFLHAHPSAAAVGSSVAIIDQHFDPEHESGVEEIKDSSQEKETTFDGGAGRGAGRGLRQELKEDGGYKIIEHPCLAEHVRWRLLFHSCLAHPTVMMRKSALLRSGGYVHHITTPHSASSCPHPERESDALAHVEDYHLWLRFVGLLPSPHEVRGGARDACGAACAGSQGSCTRGGEGGERHAVYNLGDVLLLLRKHSSNISSEKAQEQAANALKLRQHALTRLLLSSTCSADAVALVSGESVEALARPERAQTCQHLQSAQALLEHLRPLLPSIIAHQSPDPPLAGEGGGGAGDQAAQVCKAARDVEDDEDRFKGAAVARRAVDLEIQGRAAELGTEALKRLDSGDPLAMQVWRNWLTSSSQSNAPAPGNVSGGGRTSHGESAPSRTSPHPLLSLLKGLGR